MPKNKKGAIFFIFRYLETCFTQTITLSPLVCTLTMTQNWTKDHLLGNLIIVFIQTVRSAENRPRQQLLILLMRCVEGQAGKADHRPHARVSLRRHARVSSLSPTPCVSELSLSDPMRV